MKFRRAALACAAFATLGAHAAPHVHGAVRLDVTVEPKRLTLQLSSPLEALVGFERAPRTAAERQRVDAALARLKAGATLFAIDPQAGCAAPRIELRSPPLGLGGAAAAAPAAGDGHAELDGSYEFDCRDAARAGHVDLGLFDAFAGIQRIDVQGVTPRAQFKRTLRRPAARLLLAR